MRQLNRQHFHPPQCNGGFPSRLAVELGRQKGTGAMLQKTTPWTTASGNLSNYGIVGPLSLSKNGLSIGLGNSGRTTPANSLSGLPQRLNQRRRFADCLLRAALDSVTAAGVWPNWPFVLLLLLLTRAKGTGENTPGWASFITMWGFMSMRTTYEIRHICAILKSKKIFRIFLTCKNINLQKQLCNCQVYRFF